MNINPNTKASAFAAMTSNYLKVDALLGGTDTMRAARTTLLPQHAEESNANYETRLKRSTLVNYYRKAIDAAVGHACAKPLLIDGMPAELSPLIKDIDGAGSTLDQFAQENLWNAINHGVVAFVVDYPELETLPRTLAEARNVQARSYAYPVVASQMLAAYAVVENGQERLAHVRWSTTEVIPSEDFLNEEAVTVVIAYDQLAKTDPVTITKWRDQDGRWMTDGPKPILGVDAIPVVPAYGWKTGLFTGRPVLSDLADLNVAHWQSLSEQSNILSIARVPFLHAKGTNLNSTEPNADGSSTLKQFTVSVHAAAITGPDGEIKWVETSGASIAAGAANITYLEEKMDQMGLVPAVAKPGDGTATAHAINAAEAQAQLKALCVSYGQALSKVLYLMSLFEGVPAPIVTVSVDALFNADVPQVEPQLEESK